MTKKQFQSQFALTKIEETIRLFDSFGSVYQTSKQLIAVFDEVDRPDNASTVDYRSLIAYIGSIWARMVHAIEIEFDLPQGMELFVESRETVDSALKRVDENHPTDRILPGFVLARWNDITAKLHYFSGDHLEAAKYWDIAMQLINHHNVDFIKADVFSSRLRNKFEHARISTSNTSVNSLPEVEEQYLTKETNSKNEEFATLIAESKELLKAFNIPGANASPQEIQSLAERFDKANWQDRGRLRGLINLYQNNGQYAMVRILATALRDELRLMQSYHSEAGSVWLSEKELTTEREKDPNTIAFRPENAPRAAYLWKQVRDSEAWARGTIFARQQLARLDKEVYAQNASNAEARLWALHTGVDELINVIDAIQDRDEEMCTRRPNFATRDIEQHGWTVKYALDILEELEKTFAANEVSVDSEWKQRIEQLDLRMLDECIQMVRSHRKVIRISTFKTSFAAHYDRAFKRVYRHLTKCIDNETNDDKKSALTHEAVLWVEESTCRDLLDTIADANEGAASTATAPSASSSENQESLDSNTTAAASEDTILLHDYVLSGDGKSDSVFNVLQSSYEKFEKHAMEKPQAPQTISRDLASRVATLAKERQCYFIRFAERWDFGIDAYIFSPDGKCSRHRLLGDDKTTAMKNRGLLTEALAAILRLKDESFGPYTLRLRLLSEAIGRFLVQPLINYIEKGKEVFLIPTSFLWQLPLHIGECSHDERLFQRNTIYYSASLAALLDHKRLDVLDRKLDNERYATLNSLMEVTSGEIGGHVKAKIIGRLWQKKKSNSLFHKNRKIDSEQLDEAFRFSPEFLFYGCHGRTVRNHQGNHPILVFTGAESLDGCNRYPKTYITPYDICVAPKLRNNVVTIFGACMTGQAADRDGGEVSGFLRASMAAGAGACLLTFWPVPLKHVNMQVSSLLDQLWSGVSIGEAIRNRPISSHYHDTETWLCDACFAVFI